MQLDTITADIRSRTPWEAIDLGFAMVRAWWISIYTPLATLLAGIIAILLLVVPYEHYWVSLLILWWLKPLYHRLILHVISRQMFGDSPTWLNSLKALPDLILRTRLLSELTWRRFSFSRGSSLPIWQLERLGGKGRSQRHQLLLSSVHGPSVWLNIAIFSFQIILNLSFFMLIWLFIPEYYTEGLVEKLFTSQFNTIGYSIEIITVLSFVMVMIFLEPYYIAASFAMYINRRTQLEAWDIEINFRQMASRLTTLKEKLSIATVCVIAATLCSTLTPQKVLADDDVEPSTGYIEQLSDTKRPVEDIAKVIQEVMKHDNLRQEEVVERLKWIDDTDEDKDVEIDNSMPLGWLGSFFAMIIEYTLWIVIALGIIALFIYRKRWLPLLVRVPDELETLRSDIMFGMDLRKESLPDDVETAARSLWQEGKVRDSLSLLYRCALAQLINHDKLPLEHSHTEGDILKLSQPMLPSQRHQYLQKLTQSWVKMAYAHESPPDTTMNYLLENWNNDFSVSVVGEHP